MTPDSKVQELIIANAKDEKLAAVLEELLLQRRLARRTIVQLMEARDFYKRQTEYKDLFRESNL